MKSVTTVIENRIILYQQLAKGFVKCGKGVVWYMRLTHTFDITHEARWVLYYTVEGNFQLILVKSATHSSN